MGRGGAPPARPRRPRPPPVDRQRRVVRHETIGKETEEASNDRHRDAMGEAGVGGPPFDAVAELVPAEQLDVGVLRSARHDLDVGIETRDEASTDGRPGDRDDRRIVALPWRTQPHRDDGRRREIGLVDAGGDPRRHVVATCRRDEHAEPRIDVGAEPGDHLLVREVQAHEVVDEHRNPSSNVMSRSSARCDADNRVVRPRCVPHGTFGPAQRPAPSLRSTPWPQKIAPCWVGPRSSSRSERS